MYLHHLPLLLALLNTSLLVQANHLQIQNAAIASTNAVDDYAMIQFDLSWENSWRDNENHDAAWLFLKYRIQGQSGAWAHATLHASGHLLPGGGAIEVSADGKGAFLFRDVNGGGTFSLPNVQLRWNYGVDGLADNELVEINVLGIEMVYVPQGSYWLGDGENRGGQVYGHFEEATTGNPFPVLSEAALTLGGGTAGSLGNNNKEGMYCCGGLLNGAADDFDDTTPQSLPAAFPKGYTAFYAMKYEMSQAQWVDLLNLLDVTQATNLSQTHYFVASANPYTYYRYALSGTHPNFSTSDPYAPMIYLDWAHGAAYADWAGLRPMTELEFEKACRGPLTPVMGEFPWGTDQIDLSDNLTLSNLTAANEGIAAGYTVSATAGNCWVRQGPQSMETVSRCGIFAADPGNTGRVSSGATYWGLLDMGGNCWERCVSVGHPQGRGFAGSHGDGTLAANGFANGPDWPGQFGNGYVESNLGVGYRGAGLAFPNPNLSRNARISSRRLATEFWDITLYDDGMRFVRTAP